MHELGVLYQALKVVDRVAVNNRISHVRHITLEVGEDSGYLPLCFEKFLPVALKALFFQNRSKICCTRSLSSGIGTR